MLAKDGVHIYAQGIPRVQQMSCIDSANSKLLPNSLHYSEHFKHEWYTFHHSPNMNLLLHTLKLAAASLHMMKAIHTKHKQAIVHYCSDVSFASADAHQQLC